MVVIHRFVSRRSLPLKTARLYLPSAVFSLSFLTSGLLLSITSLPVRAVPPSLQAPAPWLISQSNPTTLRSGDSGDAVAALQSRLQQLGYYSGAIDGIFGDGTEAAVREFQAARGLEVDGIAGAATREALARGSGSAASPVPAESTATVDDGLLQQGDEGDAVASLQQRLVTLGYYQGSVDGVFGPQTEAALIEFQRSQGLNADGIAGSQTLAALSNPTRAAGSTTAAPAEPALLPDQSTAAVLNPSRPQELPPPALNTSTPEEFPTPSTMAAPPEALPPSLASAPASTVSEAPFPNSGSDSAIVRLQQRLRDRGFYNGPIDGVIGPETRRAIAEAQRAYGLTPEDLMR
jgi:peptidoglycan hydrolase-like protein with peptidoglycan-binding domain